MGSLLAIAVALVGHYLYWYLPRLRTAEKASAAVLAVVEDGSYDAAVWLPFPHQTLPAVGKRVGADREVVAATLRLAGWQGSLPNRLPPARELAVATELDGTRAVAVLRLYPSAAVFARLAGRLSSSPWLRSGEFLRDGDAYRVEWSGATWRIERVRRQRLAGAGSAGNSGTRVPLGTTESSRSEEAAAPLTAALGRLAVRRAPEGWPTGRFVLAVSPRVLEIRPEESRGALTARPAPDLLAAGAVALALDGVPPRALAVFPGGPGPAELPRTGEAHREGAAAWHLPTDSLLRATGRRPRTVKRGPWSLSASRSTELAAVDRLLPRLMMQKRGSRGLWIELPAAAAELERLAAGLGASPLLTREERARLDAAATLLRGLSRGCQRLEARSTPGGAWATCERIPTR